MMTNLLVSVLSISLACSLSYRILVLTVIWSYFISRYIFIFIANAGLCKVAVRVWKQTSRHHPIWKMPWEALRSD